MSICVHHQSAPNNDYTQYFYDANGNMINVVQGLTAPVSSFTSRPETSKYLTYTYDVLGRNTGITGTLTPAEKSYTYDIAGNVIESVSGGNIVTYSYDPFGNVLSVEGGDNASKHISFAYNALGLRTSMTDETGTTNYTYNPFGELTSETKGSIIKTSTYDSMSNRTGFSVTNSGANVLSNTYTYDSLGRLTSVTQNGDTVSYTYDANGNLLQKIADGNTINYEYNNANLRISDVYGENSPLNVQYTYYLDGNMKSKTGAQNASYAYDGSNRLVNYVTSSGEEYVQEAFEYDAFNNRTKKTVTQTDGTYVTEYGYTQNNLLDFETFGEYVNDTAQIQNRTNYIYDVRGNLSTKTTLDSTNTVQGQVNYTFDYLNRLSGVTSGDDVYSYSYNGDNIRKSKTTNGNTTQYILDGMNVVYEYDAQNAKSYFMGNGLEGYLSGAQRRYYNTEPNGTVYSIYGDDTANYENIGEYTYGGYGDILTGIQVDNPFKFAGEYNDDETGLIYLRNRYYDPSTGRFISEDPAMDGNNWYTYCNNNPINFVDPWGLDSVIFVDSTMVNQAYVRSDHYKKIYNTPVTIYQVDSPKEFVDSWNEWVAKTKKSKTKTDAVEIIAHGGIADENGSGVGYIAFSGYGVYAKDNINVSKYDRLISNLKYLEANEINVNPCNSANPDIYNVVYAIMQVTDSNWYSGFDGGSEWSYELKDHKRGNGEYGEGWRSIFDVAYYVRTYQSGWYRYVDKGRLGMPLRERLGRRIFDNTHPDY